MRTSFRVLLRIHKLISVKISRYHFAIILHPNYNIMMRNPMHENCVHDKLILDYR